MSIYGTVVGIKEFLDKKECEISFKHGEDSYNLTEGRKYVIPFYQREIRWTKETMLELIRDIYTGEKFLGNVILGKAPNGDYYLIDGQQRITCITMIYAYLKMKYGDKVRVEKLCDLEMQSFTKFDDALNVGFVFGDEEIALETRKTDLYHQFEKYHKLWKTIAISKAEINPKSVSEFKKNLDRSKINVIITDEEDKGIDYFIDVNTKGVKLDVEDIFKGYLFSLNSSEKIIDLWIELKKNHTKLEETTKVNYHLMRIIEHHINCRPYENCREKVEFDSNFLLKKDILMEEDDYTYYAYKGQHVVKMINSLSYWEDALQSIISYIKELIEIVRFYSTELSIFEKASKTLDSDRKNIMSRMLMFLVKNENEVPKILLYKYLGEIRQSEKGGVSKVEYEKLYAVYATTVFFNLFESKKNGDKFSTIVLSKEWDKECIEELLGYLDKGEIGRRKIHIQYKGMKDEELMLDARYRGRALAIIYNFFCVEDNRIKIRDMKALLKYVTDSDEYTIEHFIVNNSGKLESETASKEISKEIIKYKNSIFNFIVISRKLNDKLGNFQVQAKLSMLENESIDCEYSKMIMVVLKEEHLVDDEKRKLFLVGANMEYENFIDDFNTYVSIIINRIRKRFIK